MNSNPTGANIFIEGKNYGQTPAVISVEPKAYDVVLTKEGYGSTSFKTDIWWGTVRTDANGERTADGTRCLLDMLGLVFSFNAYNAAKCGDFKQKQYSITIPRTGAAPANGYYNQNNSANYPNPSWQANPQQYRR